MHKKLILVIILVLSLIACLRKSNNVEKNINNPNNNNIKKLEQNSEIIINNIQNTRIEEEILNINRTIIENLEKPQIESPDKTEKLKEIVETEYITEI